LEDGHKVKVTLQFRGREMAHPELGSKILDAVLEQLGESVKVETQARLEGRNMTMVLAPDKKAVKKPEKSSAKPPAPGDETAIASESGESHAENEDQ
jgi:translation initiation factor IF-3